MAIGQVILGVRDLAAAAARFEAMGFMVLDGGVHPGLGTANRVIPLGNAYLELLGVIDRDEAEASEFGRALLARIVDGDRLVRWSIRTEQIEEACARLGLTAERRQRRRPDGSLLTWQSAGMQLSWRHPWLPFFMQWDTPAEYPGATPIAHPVGNCSLAWLEVSTPDPARLARWIDGQSDLPLRPGRGEPGIDAVAIVTPAGEVVVSADR